MLRISLTLLLLAATTFGNPSSLHGTVMCGYQGWFATPTDGSGIGWVHYGFQKPGQCHIDLWPDLREFSAEERFDTPLKYEDGSSAQVFSSRHPQTVRRHFEWMRDYGIDGIYLQRFGTSLKDPRFRAHQNAVLHEVRESAKATGRTWCIMYDLSGLNSDELTTVIQADWKSLKTELKVTDDPNWQKHDGKPVVAVWGIGFNDGRAYSLEACKTLLDFLSQDTQAGGQQVVAGVPWHWRSLKGDALTTPQLHKVLQSADIISPWSVGRYGTPQQALQQIPTIHAADAEWCRQHGKEYLPVIFPGFSWRNLSKMRGIEAPLNAIPRLGGNFLWTQAQTRIQANSTMLYIAMFDELDEGTAIFKTSSRVPTGTEGFVTEPELPSDHYLWLSGQIGKSLRKEIPLTPTLPKR